ncbi:hypothetical protein COOONC_04043 [Cooperia oncophora]
MTSDDDISNTRKSLAQAQPQEKRLIERDEKRNYYYYYINIVMLRNPIQVNHLEWRNSVPNLASGCVADGAVFSLLVEDPRISRPRFRKVPVVESSTSTTASFSPPQSSFWNKDARLKALSCRMTDSELNTLKGKCLGQIKETEAKIPVLVVFRSGGSGRADTLSGCELIVPCGFGMYIICFVAFFLRDNPLVRFY